MDRKKWLCTTVIISVILVLLFAAAMIYGYSGLKEEWLQNDGWSHRPLGEYVAHENFGASVGVSAAICIGLNAIIWGGSSTLYRILDKKRK